jgi:hypothetical protein
MIPLGIPISRTAWESVKQARPAAGHPPTSISPPIIIKKPRGTMKTGKIQVFHHLGTGPASRIERSYKTTTHVRLGTEAS